MTRSITKYFDFLEAFPVQNPEFLERSGQKVMDFKENKISRFSPPKILLFFKNFLAKNLWLCLETKKGTLLKDKKNQGLTDLQKFVSTMWAKILIFFKCSIPPSLFHQKFSKTSSVWISNIFLKLFLQDLPRLIILMTSRPKIV